MEKTYQEKSYSGKFLGNSGELIIRHKKLIMVQHEKLIIEHKKSTWVGGMTKLRLSSD